MPEGETFVPVDLFEMTIGEVRTHSAQGSPGLISAVPGAGVPNLQRRGHEAEQNPPSIAPEAGDHDGLTRMGAELDELIHAARRRQPVPDREPAARLELSTGQSFSLDQPVIVGRRPEAHRFSGTEVPQLVEVPSPEQDISRSHVEIKQSTAGVSATDLNSTNGSLVRTGDGITRTLDQGRSLLIDIGDRIEIGDGITITLVGPR